LLANQQVVKADLNKLDKKLALREEAKHKAAYQGFMQIQKTSDRNKRAKELGIHPVPCGLWGWRYPEQLDCVSIYSYEGMYVCQCFCAAHCDHHLHDVNDYS
jgi:hypothetical protein